MVTDKADKAAKKTSAKAAKKAAAKGEGENKTATNAQETVGTQGPSNQPKNAMSDIRDHSVSAAEMASKKGTTKAGPARGANLAAADADTADRIEEESAEEKKELDKSTYGRLSRSGYVLNEVEGFGERYIGRSIQLESDVPQHIKNRTRITNIAEVRPWTGLTVKPIGGGEAFALGEFPKDATPEAWLGVLDGKGKNLIPANG